MEIDDNIFCWLLVFIMVVFIVCDGDVVAKSPDRPGRVRVLLQLPLGEHKKKVLQNEPGTAPTVVEARRQTRTMRNCMMSGELVEATTGGVYLVRCKLLLPCRRGNVEGSRL